MACASFSVLSLALQSCSPVKYVNGSLTESGIHIDLKDFETKKGLRNYLIVRNDDLQYPICVYRINETTYTALWMQCTHQGAELQVSGDQLTCPAHGSEFDKMGRSTQPPAVADLKSFPVKIVGNQLFIDLRKQS